MSYIGNSPTQGAITGGNIVDGSIESIDLATLTNIDINSGSIDGTIIGASSAAAGTFSGLTITAATPSIQMTDSDNNADSYIQATDGNLRFYADDGNEASNSIVTFNIDGSEKARLDSSGNFGIGNSSPSSYHSPADNLVLGTSGDNGLTIASGTSSGGTICFADGTSGGAQYAGFIDYQHNGDYMRFGTNSGTERMRIDSSGNMLLWGVGSQLGFETTGGGASNYIRTADDYNMELYCGRGSTTKATLGSNKITLETGGSERARLDSSGNLRVGNTSTELSTTGGRMLADGRIIAVADGKTCFTARRLTDDGDMATFVNANGIKVGSIGTAGNRPFFASTSRGLIFVGSGAVPCTTAGAYEDNIQDLGRADGRFDDVYATNGTINTSDRNEKQDIETLSDAEQRVAQACKGLLRKFRWKDSVAEKGDDARIHFGIIAQDLQDAFTAEGLDAGRYAMFISSTWTDEETGEERTRLGVRYPELLAFIITTL